MIFRLDHSRRMLVCLTDFYCDKAHVRLNRWIKFSEEAVGGSLDTR